MFHRIRDWRGAAYVCVAALATSRALTAQVALTEHTLALERDSVVAAGEIDDASWLVGHWVGEGLGGVVEEIWNEPRGRAMLGSFRLIRDDQPVFYELCLLIEEQGTLVYKVKHFHPDLTAWEDKDEFTTFDLVRVEPGTLYFHGLTLQKTDDGCRLYLAMKQPNGRYEETEFVYRPASESPSDHE